MSNSGHMFDWEKKLFSYQFQTFNGKTPFQILHPLIEVFADKLFDKFLNQQNNLDFFSSPIFQPP